MVAGLNPQPLVREATVLTIEPSQKQGMEWNPWTVFLPWGEEEDRVQLVGQRLGQPLDVSAVGLAAAGLADQVAGHAGAEARHLELRRLSHSRVTVANCSEGWNITYFLFFNRISS